jgi:hypothetical protein
MLRPLWVLSDWTLAQPYSDDVSRSVSLSVRTWLRVSRPLLPSWSREHGWLLPTPLWDHHPDIGAGHSLATRP